MDSLLFNFTQPQIELLQHLRNVELMKKAAIRFQTPEDDDVNKRHMINLDGSIDFAEYLLGFDAQVNAQAEEAKQKLLSSQPDQQSGFPSTPDFFGDES